MKKTFIIALIAFATVLAFSCNKDEDVVPGNDSVPANDTVPTNDTVAGNDTIDITLPGTSWAYSLESNLFGTSVVVNDTLSFIDNQFIDRRMSFAVDTNERYERAELAYVLNGTMLVLLDSVGQPLGMSLIYRASDTAFYRDMSTADDEMSSIFEMLGVTEMAYRMIR